MSDGELNVTVKESEIARALVTAVCEAQETGDRGPLEAVLIDMVNGVFGAADPRAEMVNQLLAVARLTTISLMLPGRIAGLAARGRPLDDLQALSTRAHVLSELMLLERGLFAALDDDQPPDVNG